MLWSPTSGDSGSVAVEWSPSPLSLTRAQVMPLTTPARGHSGRARDPKQASWKNPSVTGRTGPLKPSGRWTWQPPKPALAGSATEMLSGSSALAQPEKTRKAEPLLPGTPSCIALKHTPFLQFHYFHKWKGMSPRGARGPGANSLRRDSSAPAVSSQ